MNAIATRPDTVRSLVALVSYTLRSCLPARRRIGALLPAALSLLFGVLATTLPDTREAAFAGVATVALFPLVLPVTCLVIGDAVMGAEVRSGTFAFTWLSPVPTWQIAVARWIGGAITAAAILSVAFALAAVAAGTPESAAPVAISGAFGASAYVAVFIAIGCITKRAAVWSLAFVFLGERLLGAALAGIAQLSPAWEASAAFLGLTDVTSDLEREGIPQGSGALARLAIITTVALAVANWRLRHLRLAGSTD